ncbi:hypothetical protein [Maribacter luteus]|uniref:hypothetical protein n=1 Tax=Maribacter luteus TaxID=2594478 RepID=UPI002492D53D|nr:hypothetical protein [Maribacter luteus]
MDTKSGQINYLDISIIRLMTSAFNKSVRATILVLLVLGCKQECPDSNNDDEGLNALFEPVLSHYSQKEDSLKYKAALFLMENIEGKSYYDIGPRDKWEEILNFSDSLTHTDLDIDSYSKKMDSVFNESILWPKRVMDEESITSRELIENIDLASKVWPKPWNEHLTFEEFCRLILPYRSTDEPYDISYRYNYLLENRTLIETLDMGDSLIKVAKEIMSYPSDFRYYRNLSADQSPKDIEIGKMADCKDFSNLISSKGRALGLPVVVDWAIWPNARGRHFWNTLLYNKDSILFAEKDHFWGEPGRYRLRRKVAKIYRFGWGEANQQNPISEIRHKSIDWLHDPRYEDVTAQYIQTIDISLKLDSYKSFDKKEAYLCVFNSRRWVPVAVAKTDTEKNIFFPNVGKGNVHVISVLLKGKLTPISNAFSIDECGVVSFHQPNKSDLERITLSRKTKLKKKVVDFGVEMIGSRIEFASNFNFSDSKTAFTIHDTILTPTTIKTDLRRAFRHARIISAKGKALQLAEIKFYSGQDEIKASLVYQNDSDKNNMKNIMDNDLVSYFRLQSDDENAANVLEFDFGEPMEVTELMIAPRSDVNYIQDGHLYELLYWDKEWKSISQKLAKSKEIVFEKVPANAVLWLRNLSSGIEEELFSYEKDEQVFWNSTDY